MRKIIALLWLVGSAFSVAAQTMEYQYSSWGGGVYHSSRSTACSYAWGRANTANASIGGLQPVQFNATTYACSAAYTNTAYGAIDFGFVMSRQYVPPVTCTAGSSVGAGYLSYGQSGASTWCQGGCVIQPEQFIIDSSGDSYANGQHFQTGEKCTDTPATEPPPPQPDPQLPPDPPSCQPGHYYGQVNGQTVCVPGASSTTTKPPTTTSTTAPNGSGTTTTTSTTQTTGTSPNGTTMTETKWGTQTVTWSTAQQSNNVGGGSLPAGATAPSTAGQTSTSTVTNPNGSVTKYEITKNADGTYNVKSTAGTVVNQTTNTTCTGTNCNSTTTTTTNGTTTGTTTGETTLAGLCKQTPEHPACGTDKEGSFGGACASGFTCSGDAVQCAMAKKQHETYCKLVETTSAESDLYGEEKNKTGNVTENNPNNKTENIGSGMFDYSSATGGGACISNKTITIKGQSIDLPFSSVCTWLDVLGNILVSVSSLIALRIVMRG